jgi:predicted RecA/RadA family phage recombinase
MNVNGLQRPKSASVGKYRYDAMYVNTVSYPQTVLLSAVSYSGAATNQKYLDMEDDSLQVVCGGVPKLFACGLGILKDDTKDGEDGSYVLYGQFKLPTKDSDTPAVGDFLYWDDTNKYLTTTSGGNSKAAVALEVAASWESGSNTNPGQNPAVSGRKWARVELRPML